MSTDGDDPGDKRDKGKTTPPSTLAGVVPQPRPGLPPPRSTHGGTTPPPRFGARPGSLSPPPRPSGPSQAPPFSQAQPPALQPPAPQPPAPHSAPQALAPHPAPQAPAPHPAPTAPSQAYPQAQSQPYPQTQPNAATQPYGASQSQPYPSTQQPAAQQPAAPLQPYGAPQGPGAQPPSPFAAPPGMQSDPAWAQGFSNRGGIPEARLVESESSPIEQLAEAAAEVPGRFMAFLKLSAKRAFRIRIEPSEVLPDERQALAAETPPIVDENLQAFLAWRRSVLFLVATVLSVLSIMGLIDAFSGTKVAGSVRFVKTLPMLAEVTFCAICWLQLRNWTNWRKQRKWLLVGWLLFMLTPFLVFVYPLKLAVMDAGKALTIEQMRQLGWEGSYNRVLAPFVFAMIALLQLAPKVISLMPGLIRSSMVIKLLFPGASAPGWLIVMCAPLYGLIAYALLIIPYQFSASGWFIFGVLLLMTGQALVMRSGFALAKPMTQAEALAHITRIRKFYLILLITAAISIIVGLGLLVQLLHMKWTTVVTTILKFEVNVMILTTIGTDLVVTNLDRARGYTEGKEAIENETELKIAAFVGLNAPRTPPPTDPAQH